MRFILLMLTIGMGVNTSFCQSSRTTSTLYEGETNIITTDIDLFWECFDNAAPNFQAEDFRPYLDQGSQGVKDVIPMRIESARKLASTVKSKRTTYEAVREKSLTIKEQFEPTIHYIFASMKEWYPEAEIPSTYLSDCMLKT